MSDITRAELRKRRILENSQKRLERITGRKNEQSTAQQDDFQSNKWESLLETFDHQPDSAANFENVSNNGTSSENYTAPTDYLNQDNGATFPQLENNFIDATQFSSLQTSYKTNKPSRNNLVKSRICFIAFCLIIHTTQILSANMLGNYFFLPMFILELTELLFFYQSEKNNKLTALLSLSSKISPRTVSWINTSISITRKVAQDISVYLFTYVILRLLITH